MTRERETGKGKARGGNGNGNSNDQVFCSFCGRSAQESTSMVAGPRAFICDRCIKTSYEILRKELSAIQQPERPSEKPFQPRLVSPKAIMDSLDQYVVGQEIAKKSLSGSGLQSL